MSDGAVRKFYRVIWLREYNWNVNILLLFPEQKPPEKAFEFAFSEFLRSKAHNPLVVCT